MSGPAGRSCGSVPRRGRRDPGAFADALPRTFAVAASAFGVNTATSVEARGQQAVRALDSLAAGRAGSYVGAVNNTQTFLTIGHDSGGGTMALVDDRLRISWPGAGGQPIYQKMTGPATMSGLIEGHPALARRRARRHRHHRLERPIDLEVRVLDDRAPQLGEERGHQRERGQARQAGNQLVG